MASFRDILIVLRPPADTADCDAALSTPPYGEDAVFATATPRTATGPARDGRLRRRVTSGVQDSSPEGNATSDGRATGDEQPGGRERESDVKPSRNRRTGETDRRSALSTVAPDGRHLNSDPLQRRGDDGDSLGRRRRDEGP